MAQNFCGIAYLVADAANVEFAAAGRGLHYGPVGGCDGGGGGRVGGRLEARGDGRAGVDLDGRGRAAVAHFDLGHVDERVHGGSLARFRKDDFLVDLRGERGIRSAISIDRCKFKLFNIYFNT